MSMFPFKPKVKSKKKKISDTFVIENFTVKNSHEINVMIKNIKYRHSCSEYDCLIEIVSCQKTEDDKICVFYKRF